MSNAEATVTITDNTQTVILWLLYGCICICPITTYLLNGTEETSVWEPPPSPLQAPVDGWIVHLVYQNDQVLDPGCFSQHGVLSRLPAFLKSSFKLSFSGRDDLQGQKAGRELLCWGCELQTDSTQALGL